MSDPQLLDLARAVGVFDAEDHYQSELARLDQQHRQRMDYIMGAGIFGALFGVYVLLAFSIGAG